MNLLIRMAMICLVDEYVNFAFKFAGGFFEVLDVGYSCIEDGISVEVSVMLCWMFFRYLFVNSAVF